MEKAGKHIVSAIETITPELIEKNQNITLTSEDQESLALIRRTVVT